MFTLLEENNKKNVTNYYHNYIERNIKCDGVLKLWNILDWDNWDYRNNLATPSRQATIVGVNVSGVRDCIVLWSIFCVRLDGKYTKKFGL